MTKQFGKAPKLRAKGAETMHVSDSHATAMYASEQRPCTPARAFFHKVAMRFSPHEFLHVLGGQAFSGEGSQEGSESLLRLLQSFARLS